MNITLLEVSNLSNIIGSVLYMLIPFVFLACSIFFVWFLFHSVKNAPRLGNYDDKGQNNNEKKKKQPIKHGKRK